MYIALYKICKKTNILYIPNRKITKNIYPHKNNHNPKIIPPNPTVKPL